MSAPQLPDAVVATVRYVAEIDGRGYFDCVIRDAFTRRVVDATKLSRADAWFLDRGYTQVGTGRWVRS